MVVQCVYISKTLIINFLEIFIKCFHGSLVGKKAKKMHKDALLFIVFYIIFISSHHILSSSILPAVK